MISATTKQDSSTKTPRATKAAKSETSTIPKTSPVRDPEPSIDPAAITTKEASFADNSVKLAQADQDARAASADAGAARERKGEAAVATIRSAFLERIGGEDVRSALLAAGVLKGTVSKIVTVLNALYGSKFSLSDVKSLAGSYALTKQIDAAAAAGTAAAADPAAPVATIVQGAETPQEALELIVAFIKAGKDDAERFKLAGEWLTNVTNAISKVTADLSEDDDDDEE